MSHRVVAVRTLVSSTNDEDIIQTKGQAIPPLSAATRNVLNDFIKITNSMET